MPLRRRRRFVFLLAGGVTAGSVLLALLVYTATSLVRLASEEQAAAYWNRVAHGVGMAGLAYLADYGRSPETVQELIDAGYMVIDEERGSLEVPGVTSFAGTTDDIDRIKIEFPSTSFNVGANRQAADNTVRHVGPLIRIDGTNADHPLRKQGDGLLLEYWRKIVSHVPTGSAWLDGRVSSDGKLPGGTSD